MKKSLMEVFGVFLITMGFFSILLSIVGFAYWMVNVRPIIAVCVVFPLCIIWFLVVLAFVFHHTRPEWENKVYRKRKNK